MDPERGGSGIANKESTFTGTRFLGVPRDDQLIEHSSHEGILGGRTISEVYAQDTAVLSAAGYNWEQVVSVLQHLAIAAEYSTLRSEYSSRATSKYSNPRELVGFNGLVARRSRTRFQFWNPINETVIQGDPQTPLEAKARFTEECQIEFGGVTFVLNPQTLFLAEAHNLLEKGSKYALTGEKMVQIIQSFDQDAFDDNEQLQAWIDNESKVIYGPYKAIPSHKEKVKFIDDSEIELRVGKHGALDLKTSNDSLFLVQFHADKSHELQSVNIYGDTYDITCTKDEEGWTMSYPEVPSGPKTIKKKIPEDSPLSQIVGTGSRLIERAKKQPDRLLSDEDAMLIHDYMHINLVPAL